MVCCGVYVLSTAYVPCPYLPPINLTHRTYVTCRTEHSSDWQPFLKELTNTQMFSLFVDERALQSVGGDKLQGIMCGVSMGNRGGEGRGFQLCVTMMCGDGKRILKPICLLSGFPSYLPPYLPSFLFSPFFLNFILDIICILLPLTHLPSFSHSTSPLPPLLLSSLQTSYSSMSPSMPR
jgi:dDENN domain